mgnify:CR=1 FL=1
MDLHTTPHSILTHFFLLYNRLHFYYARILIFSIFGLTNNTKTMSEYIIDFKIRWAWHAISRMYNEVAAEHEVSTAIAYAMLSIDKNGTLSTQLGPTMGMEPRSLTRTLKSMEDKGLIKRITETKDKRKVRIFLTEKGKILEAFRKRNIDEDYLREYRGVHRKIEREEYKNKDTTPHYHKSSDTFETVNLEYLKSTTSFVKKVFGYFVSSRFESAE